MLPKKTYQLKKVYQPSLQIKELCKRPSKTVRIGLRGFKGWLSKFLNINFWIVRRNWQGFINMLKFVGNVWIVL